MNTTTRSRTLADKELVDSTELLSEPERLRERAVADSYLFFRGLLPETAVRAVRRDVLTVLDHYGWLKRGVPIMDGVLDQTAVGAVAADQMRLDIGVSHAIYDDVQRLESLHALPHHPNLVSLYRVLFDSDVLVHPRHIARVVTSHPEMAPTPVHQDFPHVQGTPQTWTCWFPLGDCVRSMGGLSVLRGSHSGGYLPVQHALGAGGLESLLCPWENEWLETDYRCGDVLTFPSFTVHKAIPAADRDHVRISLDVRYQGVTDVVESASLKPHCALTWEDIYENWRSDDLKYYWREMGLDISEFDPAYLQPGRRIC